MHKRASLIVAAAGWLLLAMLAEAQAPGVHPISGRRYAGVMGWQGAQWLERPERIQEEQPDRALDVLKLAPGSTVADVGAGSGYMTIKMARRVGPSGKVFGVDIQPEMIAILERRLREERVTNVQPILGLPDDPKLPTSSVDLILMVDVYHECQQPQQMLRKMRDALKPGGRLVLLEYRKEDPAIPIRPEHKMSVAEAKLELEAEGFTLSDVNESLPWQHILIFTRP
jgi:SAM-dependent methyltransferase